MDNRTIGLLIVGFGALVVLIGLLVIAGGLGWFGRLPGDFRFGEGNVRVYIPFASMLLVSVALTALLYLLRRLL
jgi:ABC-type transporter Mla subunit MlaD